MVALPTLKRAAELTEVSADKPTTRFEEKKMRNTLVRPSLAVRGVAQTLAQGTSGIVRLCRGVLVAGAVAFAGLSLQLPAALAQPNGPSEARWVGTWGSAPAGPPLQAQLMSFNGQTLRLIAHTSIGGSRVRIRVSNELGNAPLQIGSAHIARRQTGAVIMSGTDRVLTFGGTESVTIAPGAPVLSDPVELEVPALSDLAVSLYLPGQVQATTIHANALQTSYVSLPGNFTGSVALPTDHAITSLPFLTEIDVDAPGSAAVVAFGDSITEGANTMVDSNHRWPDLLALRLQTTHDLVESARAGHAALVGINAQLGVVNRSISGDRLLRDPGEQPLFGKAGLARFDRDVLATAGTRYLIVLFGINDIGHPGTGKIPLSEAVTPADLIAGYRKLIAQAHEKGVPVYGATLTPFEGTTFPGYYSSEKEAVRIAVNNWIRSSDEFDAVIDFEGALRDPAHPTRMLPAYDSGDHLHPNDLGMQAMANAIPLELFRSAAPVHALKHK
jgi:lysophospholipase L1-like esterase